MPWIESPDDPGYLKTYTFYRAMGFLPLETLPLWDETNPCLVLVKPLHHDASTDGESW